MVKSDNPYSSFPLLGELGESLPWLVLNAEIEIDNSIFTARTRHCLKRAQVKKWGDLACMSVQQLMEIPQFGQVSLEDLVDSIINLAKTTPETSQQAAHKTYIPNEILQLDVGVLNFTERPSNCLKSAGIQTIKDLLSTTREELFQIRGFGELSYNEITGTLALYGMSLATEPGREFPNPFESLYEKGDEERGPEISVPNLITSWLSAISSNGRVGDILQFSDSMMDAPDEVQDALNVFLESYVRDKPLLTGDFLHAYINLDHAYDAIFRERLLRRSPKTLERIGEEFNLTRERIRQIASTQENQKIGQLSEDKFKPIDWIAKHLANRLSPFVYGPAFSDNFLSANSEPNLGSEGLEQIENYGKSLLSNDLSDDDRTLMLEILWWRSRSYLTEIDGWLVCNEYVPQFMELKTVLGESVFMDANELKENIELIRPNKSMVQNLPEKLLISNGYRQYRESVWINSGKSMRETYPAIFEQEMRPLLPAEVIELLGSGSVNTLGNYLSEDDRFVRVDINNRFAHIELGMEEYSGIYQEIVERIERGNGEADVEAVTSELTSLFGVSEKSVQSYLGGPSFLIEMGKVSMAIEEDYIGNDPTPIEYVVSDKEPENLKIFQRRYPQFDARKYLNQQFKQSELYYDSSLPEGKRRILFIAPSIYDAAKKAGGPFIQKKDALKYMIGTYKDGELVKGDAL